MILKLAKVFAAIAIVIGFAASVAWYLMPLAPSGTRIVISYTQIGGMRGILYERTIYGSGISIRRPAETPLNYHFGLIPASDVARVVTAVNESGFFELRDRYDDPGKTDQGFSWIDVEIGGRHKSILHDWGDPSAPGGLRNLEHVLSELDTKYR